MELPSSRNSRNQYHTSSGSAGAEKIPEKRLRSPSWPVQGSSSSASLLPHLFDYSIRHASTPTGDGKRNMGLGLSVCSAVVKAHGGRLTARNHKDGAEFIFCLPVSKEESI